MKKIAFLLLFSAILFSCVKGDKGDPGINGVNGNANVISYTANTTATNWFTSNSGLSWNCQISVPQLTQDVLNTGVVNVYEQDGSNWVQLNFTAANIYNVYSETVGAINIVVGLSNNSISANPGNINFKIEIIPHQ